MIHIFDASSSGSLKYVLRKVVQNKEGLLISGISSLLVQSGAYQRRGIKSRFDWMKECINDEYDKYSDFKQKIDSEGSLVAMR